MSDAWRIGARLICCWLGLAGTWGGCAAQTGFGSEQTLPESTVVVGRAVVVEMDQRGRRYPPSVRFLELVRPGTGERYRIDVRSADTMFVLTLPPGEYRLNRIQINEGPFLSMAEVSATFTVESGQIAYVGTWRFGIDGPRYERMVLLSLIEDDAAKADAEREALKRYPALASYPVESRMPVPSVSESRLHEVMPYPNYPRYFRRHWW